MADIRSTVLSFTREPTADIETVLITVHVARAKHAIGTIRWDIRWRQYVFMPLPGCSYNARCLDDIRAELVSLMDAWARAKGRPARLGASKFTEAGIEQPEATKPRPRRKRSGSAAIAGPTT